MLMMIMILSIILFNIFSFLSIVLFIILPLLLFYNTHIQNTKRRTSDLIPLCHPLPLSKVHVDIKLDGNRAIIECECRVTHKTGVEMEALAGASVAALTIYDMVKAVSHNVRIESTFLVKKSGGKRDVSKN